MVVWQAGSTSLPKCGRTYSHGTCLGGRGINTGDAGGEGGVCCDRCRLIEGKKIELVGM